MNPGRDNNKAVTSTTKEGLNTSAATPAKIVMPASEYHSGPGSTQYAGEDESIYSVSGPGNGEISSSPGKAPHRWGHTTPSGSRIELNDSNGQERIEIVHRSGAALSIDPDGSVFLSSTSQRGAGVSAPYGDYFISSGGQVIIKGSASVSVETSGDLTLQVGGTLFLNCGAISVNTKAMDVDVDGTLTETIKNDRASVIGGIRRETIAGDARMQVTGQNIEDIGANYTQRIGGEANISTKSNRKQTTGGNYTESTTGNLENTSGGTAKITSTGAMDIGTNAAMNISSGSQMDVASGADLIMSGSGSSTVSSGGTVKLSGSAVNATPAVDLALWSEEAVQAGQATSLGGSLGAKPTPQGGATAAKKSAGETSDPDAAQVADATDIIDNITSEREVPSYPGNAKKEHSNAADIAAVDYEQMDGADEAFNQFSSGNKGNSNPASESEEVALLPEDNPNRKSDITLDNNVGAIPGYGQYNTKISKHFTLAQLVNGTTTRYKPSPSEWDRIVTEAVKLARNVLDPIKDKFPNILVTSWYRPGTRNHGTGRAIDIVVDSRSTSAHAEIARFATEGLPVDQVFLEKNSTGRSHVHLRVGSGKPTVFTCGDSRCKTRTNGISVAYLVKKGVPNT